MDAIIEIKKSPTADTRTCDYANVSKETLLKSSKQHIVDVGDALTYFRALMLSAQAAHDHDKITGIDWFHSDFITGFKETGWWDNHRKVNRHHLAQADGVPEDVNLIDVLEYVADCVMASSARGGDMYPITLPPEVLEKALKNTADLLKSKVVVVEEEAA